MIVKTIIVFFLAVFQFLQRHCKQHFVPLWPSGQSSWLQIQRSRFNSQRYQIFWEVVGLEQGPLSLVSTIEELLERKSSGSSLENREYGRRDLLHWPRNTVYPQMLALTLSTNGSRSIGIVHSQTEFSFIENSRTSSELPFLSWNFWHVM
jgi:hypothetical protein